MLKSALIILATGHAAAAQAACITHLDKIQWLFEQNNQGFGKANVQILRDITADALKDMGYDSVYDIDAEASATHDLELEYSKTKMSHKVILKFTDTKTHKTKTFNLASQPLLGVHAKKLAQAKEILFDMAEERYFTTLKKLPHCHAKD